MDSSAIDAAQASLWFLAGIVSFYFSLGNARIWTTISTGFFLVFVSQAYLLAPWAGWHRLAAIHSIVGTIAILAITHGLQEYYVFTRTLEVGGSKAAVYATTLAVVLGSAGLLLVNPEPTPAVLRHVRMIENTTWMFLSIIAADTALRIFRQVRDTPVAKGFLAFAGVFACFFLWRGSELYLQVFCWDSGWSGAPGTGPAAEPVRTQALAVLQRVASIAAALSVGGTFAYLFRALR